MLINLLFHHLEHLESLRERHVYRLKSRVVVVYYLTHKRPPPVPVLGQPNPVHIPGILGRILLKAGFPVRVLDSRKSIHEMEFSLDHALMMPILYCT